MVSSLFDRKSSFFGALVQGRREATGPRNPRMGCPDFRVSLLFAAAVMLAFVVCCRLVEVRDGEEQRKKDRENWAILEGENEARLKKHVSHDASRSWACPASPCFAFTAQR